MQRYFCKSCKKYFRETTGKVIFGLKKGNLLTVYLYHMLLGNSIKKCAEQTGICIQTSFDWRHKILSAFDGTVPDEATKRGINNEQIAVVVTCDRSQNKELRVTTRGRISKKDLDQVFDGKLEKIETLCTDTHRSYTALATSKELDHQKFNVSKG